MKISKGSVFVKKGSPYLYINISINKKRYLINTYFEHDKIEHVETVELPLLKAKLLNGEITLDNKEETSNKKSFYYYSSIYLNSKKFLKIGTLSILESNIKRFNKKFGDDLIINLKASDIENYLFSLDIQPLVFRNYLTVFKGIFEKALLDGEININICKLIKPPKNKPKEIEPFSVDEVNLLINESSGWFKNYLAIAFYTGCRVGELFALKWQNIDLKKKRIYINASRGNYKEGTTKTGKSRYVPIFDNLVSYIKSQRLITGMNTYVFLNSKGNCLTSSGIARYHWNPLLKRLNLPQRPIYNTRHTFATNMIMSNIVDMNKIAYWLGHSNLRMLILHYNKFINSDLDNFDSDFDVFSVKNCHNESRTA